MTFCPESGQPSVDVYTLADLKRDPFFWPRHGAFVDAHPRVEVWKPYLIKKRLAALADGASLLYLDAGWRLSGDVAPLVARLPTENIIGLAANQPEGDCTKMDVLLKLRALPLAATTQLLTSAILLYVCPATRRLVNRWYALACDYHYVDDSPSVQRDLPDFRQHQDRALFSLLAKTHGLLSPLSLADKVDGADAVGRTEVDHDL